MFCPPEMGILQKSIFNRNILKDKNQPTIVKYFYCYWFLLEVKSIADM